MTGSDTAHSNSTRRRTKNYTKKRNGLAVSAEAISVDAPNIVDCVAEESVNSKTRRRSSRLAKLCEKVEEQAELASTTSDSTSCASIKSDSATLPNRRRRRAIILAVEGVDPQESQACQVKGECVDSIDTDASISRKKRRATKKRSPYFSESQDPAVSENVGGKRKRKRIKQEVRRKVTIEVDSMQISDRQAISEDTFGLLQEVYAPDALRVLIVAMFCNQTPGHRARPFIADLFERYPDAESLSKADQVELAQTIRPLGLFNVRAKRLIQLAKEWLAQPPVPGTTSKRKGLAKKLNYPDTEISHLPGCGPYAMDCYRIFCAGEAWRSVRPDDKELKPYVQWKWSKEGVDYKQLLLDDALAR